MYKNNWIKRGAVAAVAAGLMLGALPGVAMAAEISSNKVVADTPLITKNWTVASPTQFDQNQKFHFTVTPLNACTEKVNNNPVTNISDWDFGDVVLFGSDLTTVDGNKHSGSKKASDIFTDKDFDKPGIYYFELREDATKDINSNVVYSGQVYTVRVQVSWDDSNNYNATKIVALNIFSGAYDHDKMSGDQSEDQTVKLGTAAFDNTAKASHSLTVNKQVAGTAANTSDLFDFTVTLSGLKGQYDASVDDEGQIVSGITNGKITAEPDGTATVVVKLTDNDTLTINNLPEGAKYTVTETESDYTETHTVNGGDVVAANDKTLDVNEGLSTGEQTVGETNSIVFTNNKGFIPNTGITANSLPFVGVAAVAAAGAVTLVISRKRRAGEEF